MSKTNIVIAVLGAGLFLVLIFGAIRYQMNSAHALRVLSDGTPVKKVDMTIMISPNFDGKKQVVISEKDLLDSLGIALRYHNTPVRVNISKDKDVHVMLDVYKGNSKVSLEVINSKYNGWVLKAGNYNYSNDYIFRIVKKYI